MRILLATVALLVALPGDAYAADVLINNGDDCSNPDNVIDHTTCQNDTVIIRNFGCPPAWPSGSTSDPCPSPGAPMQVARVAGGDVRKLYVELFSNAPPPPFSHLASLTRGSEASVREGLTRGGNAL